jgi:ADP-heptose:LPS heptosyltransferase
LLDKNFGPLMKALKEEKFDYIIDLHRNLRTGRVRFALRRVRFAFEKLNWQKWLLVNLKLNKMPAKHIVDRYLKTIHFFIDEPDEKGLDYFIPKNDEYDTGLKEPYLVMVIGANHYTKQMPDDKMVQLCNALIKPIVLLGGKADVEKAKTIEKLSRANILNLTGKLSINQSASVVKKADWVITPDTGLMHIAAAFNRRIISYWGNTVPEFGMTPYKTNPASQLFQVKNLTCRPCSKIGFEKCPKKHFNCMMRQDIDAMAKLANN